jgi:methionyl aminopeptidase
MLITEEVLEKLKRAGDIAKKVVKYVESITKPGVKVLDLATNIENYIRSLGGEPAFPVNIGINWVAAHYTPTLTDESVIPDGSLVKVDIGVHVDGYIADTAITICFNPIYEALVEATKKAVEKAIEVLRPGVKVAEIGKVIEDVIRSYGFKSIKNLSGHGLDRYVIHSGVIIPNFYDRFNTAKLRDGVYAIEPFATNGAGLVVESDQVTIYALKTISKRLTGNALAVYEKIYRERQGLPFTTRWYVNTPVDVELFEKALVELKKQKVLVEYPVLVEKKRGMVSQFEHTVVIAGRDVIVTTS